MANWSISQVPVPAGAKPVVGTAAPTSGKKIELRVDLGQYKSALTLYADLQDLLSHIRFQGEPKGLL